MLVIEGPDGAGKTNLVTRLRAALDLDLVPRAVSSDANYQTPLDDWVDQDLARGWSPRIYDRHQLISHLMYGPTMRRTLFGRFKDPMWFDQAWEQFLALKPTIIICLPPLETVKANLEVDEFKVAQTDIEVFYWNYYAFVTYSRCVGAIWDYTQPDNDLSIRYRLREYENRMELYRREQEKKNG